MGCDIHVHVEVKIDGAWHHYNHPRIDRSYMLFSRMADVRNDPPRVEPISQPRGIPDDATQMTKFDCAHEGSDGHSHSWLSGSEVAALTEWVDGQNKTGKWYSFEHEEIGYIFGNGWDVAKHPGDYPEGLEDARIVFWFDN